MLSGCFLLTKVKMGSLNIEPDRDWLGKISEMGNDIRSIWRSVTDKGRHTNLVFGGILRSAIESFKYVNF